MHFRCRFHRSLKFEISGEGNDSRRMGVVYERKTYLSSHESITVSHAGCFVQVNERQISEQCGKDIGIKWEHISKSLSLSLRTVEVKATIPSWNQAPRDKMESEAPTSPHNRSLLLSFERWPWKIYLFRVPP